MKIVRAFTTPESISSATSLITAYFEQNGYKQAIGTPELTFERGSTLGTWTGLSIKKWHAFVRLNFKRNPEGGTDVTAAYDVDTSGQMVTKGERGKWEKEVDGLVEAAFGRATDLPVELAVAEATTQQLKQETRVSSGASWFFLIALLSFVNSLFFLFDQNINFLIGLGLTQLVDGFAYGLAGTMTGQTATLVRVGGLLVSLLFVGLFVWLGLKARRGKVWAFIVGLVIYALDALLFVLFEDWKSAIFHGVVLAFIIPALLAAQRSARAASTNTRGPIATAP